ncbi:MAG: polysaccharide deacetylase family protein [Bacteroidales bacterium]|nr:polysaccharide deacetylase family protein [Bacteroidales bacterium]
MQKSVFNIKKFGWLVLLATPVFLLLAMVNVEKKDHISSLNNAKPGPVVFDIIGFSSNFNAPKEAISLRKQVKSLARISENNLYINGQTNSPRVTLTFDDGPDAIYTDRIVEILNQYDVKGTFFCIGQNVVKYPQVVEKINSFGHIVANHSFSHKKFTQLSSSDISLEISKTNNEIFNIISKYPNFIRPPYGAVNQFVLNNILAQDMVTVYWSLDVFDWLETKEFVLKNIKQYTRNDEIIILHCNKNTAENLPQIIELLIDMGYDIVRLDKIIKRNAYQNTSITDFSNQECLSL